MSLSHANIPESANPDYIKNRTLEEKILHYIDHITSGSEIIDSYDERLVPILKKETNIEFSESFREKYDGISLFELQMSVVGQEQAELAKMLGIDPKTLPRFVREKIRERIES